MNRRERQRQRTADLDAWQENMLRYWLELSGRTVADVAEAIDRHEPKEERKRQLVGVQPGVLGEIASEFRPHPWHARFVIATLGNVTWIWPQDFFLGVERAVQELSIAKPWRRELYFAADFEARTAAALDWLPQ